MKSVTVTAPQFNGPRHQMSDDPSVDAVGTAVVGYPLKDPRGADAGKSLSKEAISTALARGTTGGEASFGAPAGSATLDSSVLSTIAESTTLTMNLDNSNSHEMSVAGVNGRTDMRRDAASDGFDGPTGHGTVNSSVGSSIYEPGSVVPSDVLETPAFAAEVAMMCSRIIRTALYRAGMAPSSATWESGSFHSEQWPGQNFRRCPPRAVDDGDSIYTRQPPGQAGAGQQGKRYFRCPPVASDCDA